MGQRTGLTAAFRSAKCSGGSKGAFFFTLTLARFCLRALLGGLGLHREAFTLHSFRRGACTQAFESGATLDDLRELGGWKGTSVNLYRSALDARKRAARVLGNTF